MDMKVKAYSRPLTGAEVAKAFENFADSLLRSEVEEARRVHKIRRGSQWGGECACGKWKGYFNRYGPTSYAVHLAMEVLRARPAI